MRQSFRHDRGAKGIDGRLDHHVGQAEHGALQTGGQADLDDLQHGFLVEAQMPQIKVHGTLFPDQQHRDHNGGYRLAEDGGQRNTATLIWNTMTNSRFSTTLMTPATARQTSGRRVSPTARSREALKLYSMVIGIPMK